MFLEELQPIAKEFFQQPLAFAGGFVSGMLRLNLSEDPLRSWLQKQGLTTFIYTDTSMGNGGRPQSISIE